MSSARKMIGQTSLILESHQYSFGVVSEDANTYWVEISDENGEIARLSLDPLDNTLAAVLSENALSYFGKDVEAVLKSLSTFLQEQIGAKEFILIPEGVVLPEYVAAEKHEKFDRLRQVSRANLERRSASVLAQYPMLVEKLDKHLEVIFGTKELERKLQHNKPYEEIYALIENHANFTPGKMTEYKDEEVQGKKVRFNNNRVKALGLLNEQHRLCGVIRSLDMNENCGYLSDETMNQEILPLEDFKGDAKARTTFLLAYLMNKACVFNQDQDRFLIIAAAGREDIYEAVGFEKFPMASRYLGVMKLGAPGPLLTAIKKEMLQPAVSNAAIMSNIGIMPRPLTSASSKSQNLTIIESTKQDEILAQLRNLNVEGAHFTNGTYALSAELIVPTTLAGFKYSSQSQPNLPLIIAVNSDESMKRIGKADVESQMVRALKVAEPLAQTFPDNKIIVLFYDEETPNSLYEALNRQGYTYTHHKWGYGTEPSAPKIEGAELFKTVYAYPMPNDARPVCWKETPLADKPQDIKVVDLRGQLIAKDGVLFQLPENLKQYQSPAFAEEKPSFTVSL